MPDYAYKAKSRNGKIISGQIKSSSKITAKNDLLNRGLRPLSIKASGEMVKGTSTGMSKYIFRDRNGQLQIRLGEDLPSTKELAVFTKQFSLMIENGVPMLQSLTLLKQQQKKASFQEIIHSISTSVENGSNLSEAIEPYPRVFDQLYVAMIRAGEASGRLDVILRQLVIYIEKSAKIKSQVKSAMMYPTIIVVVAIAVVSLLLTLVVPSMAKQFKDSGQNLPAITQFVLDCSSFLTDQFLIIIVGAIGSFFLFKFWKKSPKGRIIWDTQILKSPIIGDVLSKIAIGRFCSTMSTMLSSGVSILEALSICAASSGNKRIETFVLNVRSEISKGRNFAEPLTEGDLFPLMVSSMVAVGESTGTLDETLAKITEIYDDEVDTAIETMTSMIEPLMIVVIGGVVGAIVIAMYLPIFDMASTMGA